LTGRCDDETAGRIDQQLSSSHTMAKNQFTEVRF